MKIVLGSTSADKMAIVKQALAGSWPEGQFIAVAVESNVSDQPLSAEATAQGASNRAVNALKQQPDADMAIGLEGGLTDVDGLYYLICVAAMWDGEVLIKGLSQPLSLPQKVSDRVKNGEQFGVVIREYQASLLDTDDLVTELVSRRQSFGVALEQALAKKNSD